MEVPAAFREFAEKSVSQAKDTYERMKSAAEEATDVLEGTYATATKGVSDYGLKVIDAVRANTNATFDFYTDFVKVKSYSELVELSTSHGFGVAENGAQWLIEFVCDRRRQLARCGLAVEMCKLCHGRD